MFVLPLKLLTKCFFVREQMISLISLASRKIDFYLKKLFLNKEINQKSLFYRFVPQSSFRKAQENVQVITESIWFQGTVMIVIFINSIMLMFEVNNFYPSLISVYPVNVLSIFYEILQNLM